MSSDFEIPAKNKTQTPTSGPSNKKSAKLDKLPGSEFDENTAENSSEGGEETAAPEKPKYDPAELNQIFDRILFEGVYEETVGLRGGRLKVTYRTRTAEETDAITREIDTTSAKLMATLVEKRSLLNLYHSLVSFNGRDLSGLKVDEKAKFINKLLAPVVGLLITGLAKFEDKVYEACKEADSNF